MANPSTTTDETVRDASERFTREAKSNVQDFAEKAQGKASEYYGRASQWLQDNSGKTIGLTGLVLISGLFGYLIGRNTFKS